MTFFLKLLNIFLSVLLHIINSEPKNSPFVSKWTNATKRGKFIMINITKRCLALLLSIGLGLGGTASVPISDRVISQKGASEVWSAEAQGGQSEWRSHEGRSCAFTDEKICDIKSIICISKNDKNNIFAECNGDILSGYRDISIVSDNSILTEEKFMAAMCDSITMSDCEYSDVCDGSAAASTTTIYPETEYVDTLSENVKVGSRFLELFFGEKKETRRLIACGGVFGVKIKQKYPSVIEASGIPALKCGDLIISVNNQKVSSAEDVKSIVSSSDRGSVTIEAKRGDGTVRIEIVPKQDGGEYRLGITLKDVTAGIGTITFIDPETGKFGGLGHGICDSEGGNIVEMQSGDVVSVVLGGIHKGESGNPGELSGIMTEKVIGKLSVNCDVGVFGTLTSDELSSLGDVYEIGTRDEVTAGEATIISTLRNGKKAEYKIEIYDIDEGSEGSKSFKIKVKDPALVAISGGIIRGMSGSPIIQNGKLIGAVTHVLVNDPTSGYGIFIENMLDAID